MDDTNYYKPKFDSVDVLKRAVAKMIRRRKAMGQYIIIAKNGKVKRIDFAE
jgi:hypothetical protein